MSLSLAALRTPERLLVTALRLFWAEAHDSKPFPSDWSKGLEAAFGSKAGADAFAALCAIVAATSYRPLHIHGPQCFCIGADEVRLLRLVGLLQRHQIIPAAEELDAMLPPAAVQLALGPAQALACSLVDHNLTIPLRHPHMTMPSPGHLAHANVGLMLVQ
jgi:hypothetical protein